MDSADRLVSYPYVVVRLKCGHCSRVGNYRLARLAAKFGAEITMPDLLLKLTSDCEYVRARHPYRAICEARFIDLDPPRSPPDMPPAAMALKVVAGGKR